MENKKRTREEQERDSDSDHESTVQVDFDFFPPKPVDYLACKRLLVQLFGLDGEQLHLEHITEHILAQSDIGTMVKVDGPDTDPYAMISVLDLAGAKGSGDGAWSKALMQYLHTKDKKQLLQQYTKKRMGWLLNERLINMPPQIAPALFRMLRDELKEAKQKYDYFLYVTKYYKEVPSSLDEEEDTDIKVDESPKVESCKAAKKVKKQKPDSTLYYFNVEDEVLEQFSLGHFDFKTKQSKETRVADAARVFQEAGIEPGRRVFILDALKLDDMVNRIRQFLPSEE